jgi:phage terminase large subunit-like protein
VKKTQSEFITQFSEYPSTEHDDLLDAFSIALSQIHPLLEGKMENGKYVSDDKPIENWRSAP